MSHGERALTPDHLEQVNIWLDIDADFNPGERRPPLAATDPDLLYVSEPDNPFTVTFDRETNVMRLNAATFLNRVYLGGTPERLVLDHASGCVVAAARTPAPRQIEHDTTLVDFHLGTLAQVGVSGVVDEYRYQQGLLDE